MNTHTIPFGKHKGTPLTEVPSSYLLWLAGNVKLSSGLAAAVRAELAGRGAPVPAPPEPKPRRCPKHPEAGIRASWLHQRDDRKVIRGECCECGSWVGTLPMTPANVALADAGSDPGALLDLLIACADRGIGVRKVGGELRFTPALAPDLWRLERQCRGLLLGLLKDEQPARATT